MGYFDALTSSSFKTSDDGHRLFFPWGAIGRGYIVGSEGHFQRLRKRIKAYLMISLPVCIAAVIWGGLFGGLAILPIAIVPYIVWVRLQLRDLVASEERLTVGQSIANQTREHSALGLWLMEVASLMFVAGGLFILVVEPGNWMVGVAGIAFFGVCAVIGARMLSAKRRTS